MPSTLESDFATAAAALAAISMDAVDYTSIDDSSLLELARLGAVVERSARAHSALIAGEIARRSHTSLGHSGLASAAGFRTPTELVRVVTGSTARDAASVVAAGVLAHAAAGTTADERPWLASVGAAVIADGLGVEAAQSIANGLGAPTSSISADQLAAAAQQLCSEAGGTDADRLFRRARELRDELDPEGIATREEARREQRALRFHRRPDGMSSLIWLLDPESAAIVSDAYDRATSPKRGGPRFVETDAAHQAARIAHDPRSTEQLASDVFLELVRQGANADSTQLLGSGAPSVRVVVTSTVLRQRRGAAHLEGQTEPVSVETAERLACAGSTIQIPFAGGQPLDVGREHRLYTHRQRIALATRDGGCRWPGCDRPPSWTEAHHINHWARDGGRTDVADGILLCRYHHLLAHNNAWEITRDGAEYWLVPPPTVDAAQRAIAMPPRRPEHHRVA